MITGKAVDVLEFNIFKANKISDSGGNMKKKVMKFCFPVSVEVLMCLWVWFPA